MTTEPIIRESTATRVIFARVPINLYTRLTRRAKKWGGKGRKSVNQVAVVALAEWCERQEEAEMRVSREVNQLEGIDNADVR
jgi:hypothetical protein